MDSAEIIFTWLLIAVLLAVAGYFGWRQVQTLQGQERLGPEDRHFVVPQARRRLICCGLMVVFAGLLALWFFGGLDSQFRDLHDRVQAKPEQERSTALTDEYRDFARFMVVYWGLALLVVFSLLALAAVDVRAIARFGMRQRRQLQADHRADLEEEIARLRRQRNGHG